MSAEDLPASKVAEAPGSEVDSDEASQLEVAAVQFVREMLERSTDGRVSVPEIVAAMCYQLPAMVKVIDGSVQGWFTSRGFAHMQVDGAGAFI
eukprot:7253263-Prymnesium_polylepis.1